MGAKSQAERPGIKEGTNGYNHDIVVMGASMGGVDALQTVVESLPADLPASLFVVQHTSPYSRSYLAEILARRGSLPARIAIDGEPIERGRIYVAPSNRHLLLKDGAVRLVFGPRENHTRPAIDPLFRSAAVAYGPRVVGVVLSGMLDDGSAGMNAVHRCGGVGIVQDPDEAKFPQMPAAAARNDHPDFRLPLARIGPTLVELAATPAGPQPPLPEDVVRELDMLEFFYKEPEQIGEAVEISCPECGGPLRRLHDGKMVHYRCHVGHALSPKALLRGQQNDLERQSWSLYRLVTQKRKLLGELVDRARAEGRMRVAAGYEEQLDRMNSMSELALEILRLSEGR